jgi:hypothetical protein
LNRWLGPCLSIQENQMLFVESFLPFPERRPRLNYFLLKKFLASFYLLFSYF